MRSGATKLLAVAKRWEQMGCTHLCRKAAARGCEEHTKEQVSEKIGSEGACSSGGRIVRAQRSR